MFALYELEMTTNWGQSAMIFGSYDYKISCHAKEDVKAFNISVALNSIVFNILDKMVSWTASVQDSG